MYLDETYSDIPIYRYTDGEYVAYVEYIFLIRIILKFRECFFIVTFKFLWAICVYGGTLLVAQLVEALRYKPEDRGFDPRRCLSHNHSSRTMALGSTQPLTEMSTRSIYRG